MKPEKIVFLQARWAVRSKSIVSKENTMFFTIRREDFGCIAFERVTRNQKFIYTDITGLSDKDVRRLIVREFSVEESCFDFVVIDNGIRGLRLSAPITAYMEINEVCPIGCAHCYKTTSEKGKALSVSDVQNIIRQLRDLGVFEIRLTGNEPTISPKFFEIAEYIKENGVRLGINTSAYFGTRLQDKIIELHPEEIIVSLDGKAEINDLIRRKGAYDRAISFLTKLRDTDITHRINMNLSKLTIGSIEHIVEIADETKSSISFMPLRSMGVQSEYKHENILTRSEMLLAVRKITDLRKDFPDVKMITYFDIFTETPPQYHYMDLNTPCPAGLNCFIAYNGDCFPCDFLRYLGKRYLCGSLLSQSFSEIWRESLVYRDFHSIKRRSCQGCQYYLKQCWGGCWCSYVDSIESGSYEDKLCFVQLL